MSFAEPSEWVPEIPEASLRAPRNSRRCFYNFLGVVGLAGKLAWGQLGCDMVRLGPTVGRFWVR